MEVGQIWKEKSKNGTKCYITHIKVKPNGTEEYVYALYPDGTMFKWTAGGFKHNNDFTGDRVPFEDVAAILF